jgi:protein-L-isoaspartate(D-aspartate) O-methyltransferase
MELRRAAQVRSAGRPARPRAPALEASMGDQARRYRFPPGFTPAAVLAAALAVPIAAGCFTDHLDFPGNGAGEPAVDRFKAARERMVREQLEPRDIHDARVTGAMRRVPRERFVPAGVLDSAYEDGALPIGLGQTISQPFIVAYMTQALELRGPERVLEIGTGSGYQAAVLAEIAREVYTIEIVPELAERARGLLEALGYRNIRFRTGDGYRGWPEAAPFDRIMVTAAPEQVPQALVDQLAVGGRMIVPVGRDDQELVLLEKTASGVTRRSTIPVRFVPMTGGGVKRPD